MKQSIVGLKILRQLAASGLKIFTVQQAKEATKELNLNPDYTTQALHHLVKESWIIRVKRGIYAFSAESGFGEPPHDFEIAMALVEPCAISHWTAMHHHHLTQQIPNTIFAITPSSTSIPRLISKEKFHFIKIKQESYFGIEKVWIGEAQVQMTDPERTLLDGLMSPEYCGDFQEVLHAFKMHCDQMNVERVIQYALKLDQSVVKRLGWVLERLGIEESRLQELLHFPVKGYRKLDPSGPLKGPYNKKWMIQENIGA
ncbi:MAG: type IV toxin-antitoxin system AbiEi family antitoxin domain-containing protein [Chlamydiales bacterium]|nr:type IV toxin-antitoxin system AbiEi family antitoxin domain-containing protein [Chlamydiales bacterium]